MGITAVFLLGTGLRGVNGSSSLSSRAGDQIISHLDIKMQTESEPAHIFVRSSTLLLNESTGREMSKYTQILTAFPTLCESSTAINHHGK